ncbi:hypothetical protein CONPUDRAFT_141980 [Coniophora puteana RWD-64-598 SS2]|uniref:Mid2 domain-containing protein n=1 Tax=Coniophora puteana (strain RWD-64-598) TaxID=741705 RepID=A0A5M3N1Z7_CONPW|nr:uncharacterized protein CONPUDRAFT_141980 [Coniophora puteana RWD-64-598 SS2]EIW85398.1 hypothetical protein CONPUDRAFT_141980 [Coniophora puteana RWD-64-598 SS2]
MSTGLRRVRTERRQPAMFPRDSYQWQERSGNCSDSQNSLDRTDCPGVSSSTSPSRDPTTTGLSTISPRPTTPISTSTDPSTSNSGSSSIAPDSSDSSLSASQTPLVSSSSTSPSLNGATAVSSPSSSPVFSTSSTLDVSPPSSTPSAVSSSSLYAQSSKPKRGAIIGGVLGGVTFLICIGVALVIYRRRRHKAHLAPSSEFMQSLHQGGTPHIFQLRSGQQYIAAISDTPLPRKDTPVSFMNDLYNQPGNDPNLIESREIDQDSNSSFITESRAGSPYSDHEYPSTERAEPSEETSGESGANLLRPEPTRQEVGSDVAEQGSHEPTSERGPHSYPSLWRLASVQTATPAPLPRLSIQSAERNSWLVNRTRPSTADGSGGASDRNYWHTSAIDDGPRTS